MKLLHTLLLLSFSAAVSLILLIVATPSANLLVNPTATVDQNPSESTRNCTIDEHKQINHFLVDYTTMEESGDQRNGNHITKLAIPWC
jgi:hypothetical protein